MNKNQGQIQGAGGPGGSWGSCCFKTNATCSFIFTVATDEHCQYEPRQNGMLTVEMIQWRWID